MNTRLRWGFAGMVSTLWVAPYHPVVFMLIPRGRFPPWEGIRRKASPVAKSEARRLNHIFMGPRDLRLARAAQVDERQLRPRGGMRGVRCRELSAEQEFDIPVVRRTGEPSRRVHLRDHVRTGEREVGQLELLPGNASGGFVGRLAEDEMRRRKHPAARVRLDARRVEGTDVVPRGLWVHVAHEDPFWIVGLGHDEECRETHAFLRDLGDAESRRGGRFAETRESSVRRPGPRRHAYARRGFMTSAFTPRSTLRRTAPAEGPSACEFLARPRTAGSTAPLRSRCSPSTRARGLAWRSGSRTRTRTSPRRAPSRGSP